MSQGNLHNRTERNRFTRMCIGEALLSLMKKEEYDKIRVSDIVKKAGVSRMTYYHYYTTKNDVLNDYFKEMLNKYVDACNENKMNNKFHTEESIRFALTFFDDYSDFIMTLYLNGLYSVIMQCMNKYMYETFGNMYTGAEYDLYYYSGGLLNVFIKWQENGKKQSADEIAHIIKKLL